MEWRKKQPVNLSKRHTSIPCFVPEVGIRCIVFLLFLTKSAIMINNAVSVVITLAVWLKSKMLCHAAEHFHILGNVN